MSETKNVMTMAEAFDEWQRRYEEHPEEFLNEMQSMKLHRKKAEGCTASEGGQVCADLLQRLMREGKAAWQR